MTELSGILVLTQTYLPVTSALAEEKSVSCSDSTRGLRNEFTGVLTGKGLEWGGSLIRPEATGYGATYFADEMLKTRGKSLKGMTAVVSGSGNVSQYTVEKVTQLGGKVVTLSDSNGYIYDPKESMLKN